MKLKYSLNKNIHVFGLNYTRHYYYYKSLINFLKETTISIAFVQTKHQLLGLISYEH